LTAFNSAFAALNHEQGSGLHRHGLWRSGNRFLSGAICLSRYRAHRPEKIGARVWIRRNHDHPGAVFPSPPPSSPRRARFATIPLLEACARRLLPRHVRYCHLLVPGAYRGRVVGCFMTAIPARSHSVRRSRRPVARARRFSYLGAALVELASHPARHACVILGFVGLFF